MINLTGQKLVREYIELDTVDSTNRYALDAGRDGLLVTARRQTAGRGRQGRLWFSPRDDNIYMTITLAHPDPRLCLVAGVAVREALVSLLEGASARIKWPNDILVLGRKVCGILCQTRGSIAAIGIGVNVNQTTWPDELKDTAVSLKLATGKTYGRDEVIQAAVQALDQWFDIYHAGGFEPVRQAFLKHCHCAGETARLEDGTPCVIRNLTPEGFLEVEVMGIRRIVVSGDVRLDCSGSRHA